MNTEWTGSIYQLPKAKSFNEFVDLHEGTNIKRFFDELSPDAKLKAYAHYLDRYDN
jgi:hypothetical protein